MGGDVWGQVVAWMRRRGGREERRSRGALVRVHGGVGVNDAGAVKDVGLKN